MPAITQADRSRHVGAAEQRFNFTETQVRRRQPMFGFGQLDISARIAGQPVFITEP